MKKKLVNETDILDPTFRKAVIAEIINNQENIDRRNFALRRYEIFRDQTQKWVIESLAKEGLHASTVARMENRASNISICKKVIKKLAQSYVHGVRREVSDDQSKEKIDLLSAEMDMDSKMKKVDQYIQLFKNTLVQIYPEISTRETQLYGKEKNSIKTRVLAPYQYDIIEDINNKEKARVVILSDFWERDERPNLAIEEGTDGRQSVGVVPHVVRGDRHDQIIADRPEDSGRNKRTFIWWSDNYHFTTDPNGAIIPELSPEELENPIRMLPFVNYAEDQDGEFWADGGEDLIDGSILINKVITDMFSIAYEQGWGLLTITGKDLPKKIETGPHNALLLSHDGEGPAPSVSYASANPPLGDWMAMIEQFTALLLSTNNLSPRNVAGKLDASDFPSGIAMLIEQSESTVDVQERQRTFKDNAPVKWELIKRWYDYYFDRDALTDDYKEIGKFTDSNVKLLFNQPKPVITETELINNLKARKDLGIDRMIDLIMRDNPSMSEADALKKLQEIQAEKMQRAATFMQNAMQPKLEEKEEEQNEEPEELEEEEQMEE